MTPPAWSWATLEETCEIVLGQSPSSETYNIDGVGLPFYQGKAEFGGIFPTPVKWCSKPKKIARTNDILISVRAPVGPTNLCREDSCIGRGLAAIRPRDGILYKYLLYYLRLIEKDWDSKATGTTFKAITGSVLRKQEIPIATIPEQERIVERIESLFTQLDAGVAGLKRAQAALKCYRASVLKAACEGRLVTQDPNDEPAEELLKRILVEKGERVDKVVPPNGDLPELPKGWVWTKWQKLISLSQNGFGKRKSNTGIPTIVLRLADVVGNEISLDNVRRIRATSEEISKYRLQINDLICIRVNGSLDNVGRVVIFPGFSEPIIFCDHFIRFRLVEPKIASFYSIYFNTDYARKFIELNRVSSAGQNTISQGTLLNFTVPLLSIEEQYRIVLEVERRLSVMQDLEQAISINLKRAARLRQAVLKRAFEGTLVE